MDNEQLNTELLAFIAYLKSRNLQICMWSKNLGWVGLNCEQEDMVAAYMNAKTGGVR